MSELFSSSSLVYSYNLRCSLLLFLELLCWLIRSLLSPSLTPILFSSFLSPLFLFVSFSFPLDLSTPWYYPSSPYLFICILLCLCLSLCLFPSLSLVLSLSTFFLYSPPSLTLPIFLGQSSWTRAHWCHYQTPKTSSQSLNWRKHWSNPRSKTRNIAGELFNKFMIQKIINYQK